VIPARFYGTSAVPPTRSQSLLAARPIEDYKADRFLRSAVERQLTIVGEAAAQLSRLTPDLRNGFRI
jgi:uncharacterized protein with HEPN domain